MRKIELSGVSGGFSVGSVEPSVHLILEIVGDSEQATDEVQNEIQKYIVEQSPECVPDDLITDVVRIFGDALGNPCIQNLLELAK